MPSSAALRLQIERALEHSFPAALSPIPRPIGDVSPTGVNEVDALLDGGLPVGAISELTGPDSSGRTSLALAFLAQRMGTDQVSAWVDVSDTFDPESAAASGVCLRHLLWVRCQERKKQASSPRRTWERLDQALRATDLLLQAGGFAAIVLDLGDLPPVHASRIPLATWFRFRQAAERTHCCLVALGKMAYGQSSAAVVLKCAPLRAEQSGDTVLRGFSFEVERRRERYAFVHDIRGSFYSNERKPGARSSVPWNKRKPPSTTWSARAAWEEKRA